jgi:hypothetical protein
MTQLKADGFVGCLCIYGFQLITRFSTIADQSSADFHRRNVPLVGHLLATMVRNMGNNRWLGWMATQAINMG